MLGTMIIPLPVLGGVIGTVVGGFFGSIMGTKVALKMYEKQEAKMAERMAAFEQIQIEEQEAKLARESMINDRSRTASLLEESKDKDSSQEMSVLDRNSYELSLQLLSAKEEQSFAAINEQYALMDKQYKNLLLELQEEAKNGDTSLQNQLNTKATEKIIQDLQVALETIARFRMERGSYYEQVEAKAYLEKQKQTQTQEIEVVTDAEVTESHESAAASTDA